MTPLKKCLYLSATLHFGLLPIYLHKKLIKNKSPHSFIVQVVSIPKEDKKIKPNSKGNAGNDLIVTQASQASLGHSQVNLNQDFSEPNPNISKNITFTNEVQLKKDFGDLKSAPNQEIIQPKKTKAIRVPSLARDQMDIAGEIEGGATLLDIKNSKPIYPRLARKNNWQGTVMVKVYVDKFGNVKSLKIQNSSGYNVLDNAALKAVKKWRFNPAKLFNKNIASTVIIPVNFILK